MQLVVGLPAYGGKAGVGHLIQAAQISWAWAKASLPSPKFLTVDSCDLAKARNLLVWHAAQAKADVLLMCDADTHWPGKPEAIAQMLATGIKHQAAVIAAPYQMRNRPGYPVSIGPDAGQLLSKQDFEGKVIQVDRIATGFMAINLHWIRSCWPQGPWFQFEQLPTSPPTTVGEDYWFCRGVKERGGDILCDGRFEPIHTKGSTDERGMLAQIGIDTFEIQ